MYKNICLEFLDNVQVEKSKGILLKDVANTGDFDDTIFFYCENKEKFIEKHVEEVEVFNTNLDYERIFYDINDLFDYLEDELADYFDKGHTGLAEGERDIFARYFQDNYEILLEEYFNSQKWSVI